jgi:hypothetical protein
VQSHLDDNEIGAPDEDNQHCEKQVPGFHGLDKSVVESLQRRVMGQRIFAASHARLCPLAARQLKMISAH